MTALTYYLVNEAKEIIGKSTNLEAAINLAEDLDPNGHTTIISALTIAGLKAELAELK